MPDADAEREGREAERNRLLRRADWRFLLPSAPVRRVVCFADGVLAQAAAEIGVRLEPHGCREGEADLAVVADADATTLRAARRALRPGGACYGEWHAPVGGSPKAVRARLEEAGFRAINCYWPWPLPNRSPARYWLPLEAEGALGHFLATRAPRDTGAGRLRQRAVGLAWRIAFRTRLLRPVCAVSRKPGALPGEEQGGGGVLGTLLGRWGELGLGRRPAALSWVLFAPGASVLNKLLGFVFVDEEDEPRLVVKLPRVAEAERALAREAAALRAIGAGRDGRVAGAPSVLLFERDDPTILGETFLPGRAVTARLDHERYPRLAVKVTDWLVDLARLGTSATSEEWRPRLIDEPLEDVERWFGSSLAGGELQVLRRRVVSLRDVPLVPEHRDCAPWNLLLDEHGTLVVHDWESADPQGLPLRDLVYFLAYGAFFLEGAIESGRVANAYRALLDPTTTTGRVAAACERRYLAGLGLGRTAVPALRALTWVLHLRSQYQRLGPAATRRSLFLALLRAELRSG
jgi:Phosphotransferase enzyme family